MKKEIITFYKYLELKECNMLPTLKKYYKYDYDIAYLMIFIRQNSVSEFNRIFKDTLYLKYFLSKFSYNTEDAAFYRGIRCDKNKMKDEYSLVSSSKNIDVAFGFIHNKDGNDPKGYLLTYTAERILDCNKYFHNGVEDDSFINKEKEVLLLYPELLHIEYIGGC